MFVGWSIIYFIVYVLYTGSKVGTTERTNRGKWKRDSSNDGDHRHGNNNDNNDGDMKLINADTDDATGIVVISTINFHVHNFVHSNSSFYSLNSIHFLYI